MNNKFLYLGVVCTVLSVMILSVMIGIGLARLAVGQTQIQNTVVICSNPENQTIPCCTSDELKVRNCLQHEQVQFTVPFSGNEPTTALKLHSNNQTLTQTLQQVIESQKLQTWLTQFWYRIMHTR
jgi:hypothetical protein